MNAYAASICIPDRMLSHILNRLKDVEEYDPRVVEQLLSFMYKYTSEVLQDAQVPTNLNF